MSLSQNQMGRAFEYALALSMSQYLPASIDDDQHSHNAQMCFTIAPATERHNMVKAAKEVFYSGGQGRLMSMCKACYIKRRYPIGRYAKNSRATCIAGNISKVCIS